MKIRIRSAFSGWMRIWRMWSDSFVQAVAIKTKIHILPHLLGLVRIFLCGFDLFLLASLFAGPYEEAGIFGFGICSFLRFLL